MQKPQRDTIICRLLLGIWLHTQREAGANTSGYSLPKLTIAAIIMHYKNTKVKVCTQDGDKDFIVAGVLQGDTLDPYLFIICLVYELWTSIDPLKENGFTLAKARSRRYLTQTITDVNYADDIALLANRSTQGESQLHSLERTVGNIDLHVNTDETEFMCFNQRGDIFTLNGRSLKLETLSTM